MTRLHRFTREGVSTALGMLEDVRKGVVEPESLPKNLLLGEQYSQPFEPEISIGRGPLNTRRDAALLLRDRLHDVKSKISDDSSVWSWLGMYYLADILRGQEGARRVSPLDEVFVIRDTTRADQRRYRHYLWGSWRLFEQHGEEASFLLDERLTSWTDLAERAFGSVRIFNSVGIVPLMLRLYTDGSRRKKGYIHNSGGLRHLIRILDQLERTHDIYGMPASALLEILPMPFQDWR